MTLVSVCVHFLNFWTHRDTDTEMDTELDNFSNYLLDIQMTLEISKEILRGNNGLNDY